MRRSGSADVAVEVSEAALAAARPVAAAGLRGLVSQRLLWLLVVVGVVLRLRQYAIGRSLWMDESFVALNILDRSLEKLLTVPLDFNQAVPAGFLVVEKLSSQAFGKNEYALRLFPLICGIAAIPLFLAIARRTLSSVAVPFALGLFVVSGSLVYYSSELKPYSLDVLAVLAMYAMSFAALQRRLTLTEAALFGCTGALLIASSYAGIFAATGCGVVVLTILLLERRLDWIRPALLVANLWALGATVFLIFYLYSFRSYTGGDFGDSSGGRPIWSEAADWCWSALRELAVVCGFYTSLSGSFVVVSLLVVVSLVAAVLAFVGLAEFFFGRRREFAVLIAPVVVMLVIAAAGKFPILARSLLFVTPFMFLLIGNGVAVVVKRLGGWTAAVVVTIFAVVAVGAASFGGVVRPFASVRPAEIKSSLSYIADHWRSGDVLYVHYPTQYAFGYYAECDCFKPSGNHDLNSLWPVRRLRVVDRGDQFPRAFASKNSRLIIGTPPWRTSSDDYDADVDRISSHRRAWIIVTWTFSAEERDFMRRRLFAALERRGTETVSIAGDGTYLYLYSFRSS